MNDVGKSLLSATIVVAGAAMVVLGANSRSRMEGAPIVASNLGSLVASRDDKVQVNVSATDFYETLAEKLKEEYVEPVNDEMKLASGAVRGMVGSLSDPKSLYYEKTDFTAFLNARQGNYEGIGADIALEMPHAADLAKPASPKPSADGPTPPDMSGDLPVPRLIVSSVVPGGPADKAGVKVGDIVDSVNTHWVYNIAALRKFRLAQRQYEAKKTTFEAINKLRNELRGKFETAILPLRARQMLQVGTTGDLSVTWQRGSSFRTTKLTKAVCQMPPFSSEGNVMRVPLRGDTPAALAKAIEGKSEITLDLRNNVNGDFETMKQVLAVLAPTGEYGTLAKLDRPGGASLKVAKGNPKPPKMTLLVDSSTRGAAEILALALSSKGLAKLTGGETGGDRSVIEVVSLPDGSGYTLVTALYKPTLTTMDKKKAVNG